MYMTRKFCDIFKEKRQQMKERNIREKNKKKAAETNKKKNSTK